MARGAAPGQRPLSTAGRADRSRELAVECRSEPLLGFEVEGRRAAGLDAGVAEASHKVSDREPLTNARGRVKIAARVDHTQTLVHEARSQGDVGRYTEVAGSTGLHDECVGYIRSLAHAHERDKRIILAPDLLGGDDRVQRAKSAGGPNNDIFNVRWQCIRVDLNLNWQHWFIAFRFS